MCKVISFVFCPTGIFPKSKIFSIKAHLDSLTIPRHLMSTGIPSSICKKRVSSSLFYPWGLNVTLTLLEEPAGISSINGSGMKVILAGTCHLKRALAFPWLLMVNYSVTLMSIFSSVNSNFNVLFDTSKMTGSAYAWTKKVNGLSLI